MKIRFFLVTLILFLIVCTAFSENIFFFSRNTFAISQFWEGDADNTTKGNQEVNRKYFSNYITGSLGAGLEMVIWDMGVKRGSRLYFKTGADLLFTGPSFIGYYDVGTDDGSIKGINLNGGIFSTGVDVDITFGGTFPRTDLFWGIGGLFNFLFPVYSSNPVVNNNKSTFNFYAVPYILIGYDIFIPNTKFKISPQIRTGMTCLPVIPRYIDKDSFNAYVQKELYSGFYVDFSVAFSFFSVQWKK